MIWNYVHLFRARDLRHEHKEEVIQLAVQYKNEHREFLVTICARISGAPTQRVPSQWQGSAGKIQLLNGRTLLSYKEDALHKNTDL